MPGRKGICFCAYAIRHVPALLCVHHSDGDGVSFLPEPCSLSIRFCAASLVVSTALLLTASLPYSTGSPLPVFCSTVSFVMLSLTSLEAWPRSSSAPDAGDCL